MFTQMALDDDALTDHGLTAKGAGRILLLACGALARELIDLRDANGWDHMDLHCLPAILHNTPDRIPMPCARPWKNIMPGMRRS